MQSDQVTEKDMGAGLRVVAVGTSIKVLAAGAKRYDVFICFEVVELCECS
jgi:hypothetical protein